MRQHPKTSRIEEKALTTFDVQVHNTKIQQVSSPQEDAYFEPFICIPRVPRPGKTSWSLVQ